MTQSATNTIQMFTDADLDQINIPSETIKKEAVFIPLPITTAGVAAIHRIDLTMDELHEAATLSQTLEEEQIIARSVVWSAFEVHSMQRKTVLYMAEHTHPDIWKFHTEWCLAAGFNKRIGFAYRNSPWTRIHKAGWGILQRMDDSKVRFGRLADAEIDQNILVPSQQQHLTTSSVKTTTSSSSTRSSRTQMETRVSNKMRATYTPADDSDSDSTESKEVDDESHRAVDSKKLKQLASLTDAMEAVWPPGESDVGVVLDYMVSWYPYGRYETIRVWSAKAGTNNPIRLRYPESRKWPALQEHGWDMDVRDDQTCQFKPYVPLVVPASTTGAPARPAVSFSTASSSGSSRRHQAESVQSVRSMSAQELTTTLRKWLGFLDTDLT